MTDFYFFILKFIIAKTYLILNVSRNNNEVISISISCCRSFDIVSLQINYIDLSFYTL